MAASEWKIPPLKSHHPYVIVGLGLLVALPLFACALPVSVETYKALRGSLFTGFFTAASFLLSAKTLVILNMKKEVYAQEAYLKRIHEGEWSSTTADKKARKSPRKDCVATNVYHHLSQVGTLLSINIILALITSFFQITLGLIECKATVVICLSLALATAPLLVCSVYVMWRNFQSLYADWENEAQTKLEGEWERAMNDHHANRVNAQPSTLPIAPTSPTGESTQKPEN